MGGEECSFLFCLHLSRPRPRNLYAHIARLCAPYQGGHIIEQTKYKADQHVCVSMSAISSDPSMIESGTSELVSGATTSFQRPKRPQNNYVHQLPFSGFSFQRFSCPFKGYYPFCIAS